MNGSILFSSLFANLLDSVIKRKRFVFEPAKDIGIDRDSYNKLKKDLKRYLKSQNFKKLVKEMQNIDKYFGQFILSDESTKL